MAPGHMRTWQSLRGALLLAAATAAIGAAIILFAENYQVRLAVAAYLNLITVIGLQIFMGNSNVANLSHSGFAGLGAYMTAIFATPVVIKKTIIPNAPFGIAEIELGTVPSFFVAVVITAAVAFVVGIVLVRLSGIAATILTLAILVITNSIFVYWVDLFRGAQAFYGIPKVVDLPILIAATAVAIVIARLFKDSKSGVQLRASADDELAAKAMGVEVRRMRLIAWTIGTTIAAVGGILTAYYLGTINPRGFHFHAVFLTLAMLILGGMRSVTGAVVGVTVISVAMELIRGVESGPEILGVKLPELLGLSGLSLGIIIVGFMCLRPDGIMSGDELDDVIGRVLRKRRAGARIGGAQSRG